MTSSFSEFATYGLLLLVGFFIGYGVGHAAGMREAARRSKGAPRALRLRRRPV
jgi:hypothetical protein